MNASPLNAIRSRWNSAINTTLLAHCYALKLLERGQSFADLAPHIRDPIQHKWQELLDWACKQQIGKRPPASIERQINGALWRALTPFTTVKLGQQQDLFTDPYATPESTRKWSAQIWGDVTTTREKR